ncbi:hypothetical protein MBLNU457_3885t2 [Dothideomycetes sp. NU457]
MSGAEAALVLGLVSSVLAIFDAASQVYDAAHDAKGLTKAFQATADQIPLVQHTLSLAEESLKADRVGEEAAKSVKPVLERCKENGQKVKDAFDKALPLKNASTTERYKRAAQMRLKSGEIKKSMEIVMECLDLLAKEQIFQDSEAIHDIKTALDQLASIGGEGESAGSVHYGSGNINNIKDSGSQQNYNNSGSGKQYNATQMSFEPPEIAPLPCALLPFERDPDFVDREELGQLEEKLSAGGAKVALSGLGGVGKTQIAIEYCYRARDQSKDTWALWVHASNANRFNESLHKLADDLKIRGRSDPKANILQIVCDWLRDTRNGRWVLVLDNADDADFLLEPPAVETEDQTDSRRPASNLPRIKYWPSNPLGSIILTSRRQHMVQKLVHRRNVLKVNPMSKVHALALLMNKLEELETVAMMDELTRTLDYMPLAMAQAAAYIRIRAPSYSIQRYLVDLEQGRKTTTILLDVDDDLDEFRRDREAKNSIFLTWRISFDYIHQTRRSAAELLSLMSFYDHQGIPEILLRPGETSEDANPDQIPDASLSDDLEADILTLRDFAFISATPDRTSYEMHRLVQAAVQRWLEIHNQYLASARRSVHNLNLALPVPGYKNWKDCQVLYPHAKLAARLEFEDLDACRRCWADIQYKAARYALDQGFLSDAEAQATKSVDMHKRLYGDDHEETLISRRLLGMVLADRGQYKTAEVMLRQALESQVKLLGKEHPATLVTQHDLAFAIQSQGRYQEAEVLMRQVLEGEAKGRGKEHMQYFAVLSNLSNNLSDQKRYKEAEELCRQALEAEEKELGIRHPSTLTSRSNLASLLSDQGKFEEAEETHRRVLQDREEVLGIYHPDTLTSAIWLGYTLVPQGKHEEAEKMYRQALDGRRRVLGDEHQDTLRSAHNLAYTLDQQGKHEEAEKLYRYALDDQRRVLGEEHQHTLMSADGLAFVLEKRGKYEEAEKMYRKMLDGRRALSREGLLNTLEKLDELGFALEKQHNLEEAEKVYRKVLYEKRAVLGEDESQTLVSVSNLARFLRHRGSYGESLDLMRSCAEISLRVLGADDPATIRRARRRIEWESETMPLDQLRLDSSSSQDKGHETI